MSTIVIRAESLFTEMSTEPKTPNQVSGILQVVFISKDSCSSKNSLAFYGAFS